MWNKPSPEELARLPKIYETERIPAQEKIIHMHFFIGGSDWYIAEFDGEDTFFCFAVLNDDLDNAEWGYASLSEMESISVHGIEIDRDLHWQPVPAGTIERISAAIRR